MRFEFDSAPVIKKFKKASKNAGNIVEDAVKELGTIAFKSARQIVPVDTGRLKTSIEVELERQNLISKVEIGTDVPYAAYVEYGTSRQRAQPYMRPSLTQARRQAGPVVKAVINEYLK